MCSKVVVDPELFRTVWDECWFCLCLLAFRWVKGLEDEFCFCLFCLDFAVFILRLICGLGCSKIEAKIDILQNASRRDLNECLKKRNYAVF